MIALAMLAAMAMVAVGSTLASAQEANGAIKGSLSNNTPGGTGVADVEVSLSGYEGTKELAAKVTKTDKDGRFAFDGLAVGPNFAYQLAAEFQGAPYYSEAITLTIEQPEQTLDMKVADATTDESVVKASARHYLIEPNPTGVSVSEILIIKNSSDKTFVGGKEAHQGVRATLRFVLPKDAIDLEPVDGFLASRVLPVDGGFIDTFPIYPGDSQRILRYKIPPTGDSASFTATLNLPADKVSVLVPDRGVKVSVSNLPTTGNPDIQGEKYLLFSGQNLANGTTLEFKLDGLSKAAAKSAAAGSVSAPVVGGLALVVVLVAGTAVYLVRRRSRSRVDLSDFEDEDEVEGEAGEDARAPLDPETLDTERETLIATIARLDDLFESAKITSEEYGRLRAAKKRRLVEVVAMQRSLARPGRTR